MSYQDFGLQTNKRSQDPGEKALGYDPWTWEHVSGRNFYLCFSNWVVSRRTIEAFQKQEPVDALPNDQCQKCLGRPEKLHYCIEGKEELNRDLGICPNCIEWAAKWLARENEAPAVTIPEGTQLNIF